MYGSCTYQQRDRAPNSYGVRAYQMSDGIVAVLFPSNAKTSILYTARKTFQLPVVLE